MLIYNDDREVWHANIGPIFTPQLLALHDELAEIVESNRHDGDKTKPAALVDAYPGLGKSTAVRAYGCGLYRKQVALRGETAPGGDRRVPVIYIALSGNTQIRGLNASICRFYGLPVKGDAETLAERAVDAVLSMKTTAITVDDVHFLAGSRTNSSRMANQLKYLSNVFPVTLIYVGLGPRATSTCTRDSLHTEHRNACGADLSLATAIRLPASGLVLAAQQEVTALLNCDAPSRDVSLAEFKRLYALAWRILRGLHTIVNGAPDVVDTVLAECGGALPKLTDKDVGHDAHNAAVGTALARVALRPGHRHHEALFEWILKADRSLLQREKYNIGALAARWKWSGPELVGRVLAKLDRDATLHARLRYGSASPRPCWPDLSADAVVRRAAMIPAMLWPGWTMRLLPRPKGTADPRVATFRRGCSSFLLLPGAPAELNFERVGPLLGNQDFNSDRDSVERRLYLEHDLAPLASALAQLARALDEHGCPIDYAPDGEPSSPTPRPPSTSMLTHGFAGSRAGTGATSTAFPSCAGSC
ncbi:ATP-binding protein [Streptomyces olivoreticuli]